MANYFVTGSFKLHNPGAHKRQILDHVFCEYTLANQRLLDYCRDNEEMLKEQGRVITREGEMLDKYTAISLASPIGKTHVGADISSALKDSL